MRLFSKISKMMISILAAAALFIWALLPEHTANSFGDIVQKIRNTNISDNTGKMNAESIENVTGEPGEEENMIPESALELEEPEEKYIPKDTKEDYFLTIDQVLAIQSISFKDKIEGLKILGKLDRSELEKLIEFTGEGITVGEMQEIKKILHQRLENRDIECLNELIERNKNTYSQSLENKE